MIWFSTVVPLDRLYIDTISHPSRMHIMELQKHFLSFTEKLHLIGIVMEELDRKIWEGGLIATRCVNSPGPRHLVSIHLGFLCHLQAVCMHTAEPRVWKTGRASLQLSCLWGKKECCLWLQRCLAWGQQLHLPTDLLTWPVASGIFITCFFCFYKLRGIQILNYKQIYIQYVCQWLNVWRHSKQ